MGAEIAEPGQLEFRDKLDKVLVKTTAPTSLVDMRGHFLNAGGQLWISPFYARQVGSKHAFIPEAIAVDKCTLLTFLAEDTIVMTY